MIDSKKISVVVSGPILGTKDEPKCFTQKACESVRKFLPDAELILSTWEDSDCEGITCDILIKSKDPGKCFKNINRQICSRLAGLKAVNREYVLAIRSESEIINLDFIDMIDKYTLHGGEFGFLENRIVTQAFFPASRMGLFHMGDWYFWGHTKDVLEFWNLPYFDEEKYNKYDDDIFYNPHRYFITAFVKKYYDLKFEKKSDITEENRIIYEKVIAENFVILGSYEMGIRSFKYPLSGKFWSRVFHKEVGYTFNEWKELYNHYCGGKEEINPSFEEKFILKVAVPFKRSLIGKIFFKVRRKLFKLNYWE
jgi:hypothetical protein